MFCYFLDISHNKALALSFMLLTSFERRGTWIDKEVVWLFHWWKRPIHPRRVDVMWTNDVVLWARRIWGVAAGAAAGDVQRGKGDRYGRAWLSSCSLAVAAVCWLDLLSLDDVSRDVTRWTLPLRHTDHWPELCAIRNRISYAAVICCTSHDITLSRYGYNLSVKAVCEGVCVCVNNAVLVLYIRVCVSCSDFSVTVDMLFHAHILLHVLSVAYGYFMWSKLLSRARQ